MPLSFVSWPPHFIQNHTWLVVLLITYLVSVGSVLLANLSSGRRGHDVRTINDLLLAFLLAVVGYYVRIALTSELDWDQRWPLFAAMLFTAAFVLAGKRNASAKRFLAISQTGGNVVWPVLRPNITLGLVSIGILFYVAPMLPQPQLGVRTPSGKPAHVSIERVLPDQDTPYDGAPLYVLDHVAHLKAGAAPSALKFAGVIESEKLAGSGRFNWVLSIPNDFRNFAVSVRTAYLVNREKPRPFQVLEVVPRGGPPYHELAATVPESHSGDRILVVLSVRQVGPGRSMPEDVRKILEPTVE